MSTASVNVPPTSTPRHVTCSSPAIGRHGSAGALADSVRRMVSYEVDGPVAVITIRRPDARNAVNEEVAQGIESAIDRLEDDPEVWVGILTGEGSVFSAGADLKAIAAGKAPSIITKRGGFGGIARRARTKPMIAAVDGPALAGGT